jgi:hypothetical protein
MTSPWPVLLGGLQPPPPALGFDLPKMGVAGNTHMMMMDRNSDQVAALIQKWMGDRGLMQWGQPPARRAVGILRVGGAGSECY